MSACTVNKPSTLAPLPNGLHHGLTAVTILALLSLVTSSALFLHLSYRLLVLGHRRRTNHPQHAHANQFIILIFNLVLADIQQSVAFALNAEWITTNSITAGTATCWAQGWFVSTGDLASGVFTFAIAVHSFADIVCSYRLSRPMFLITIALLWTFVYLAALIGIAMHPADFYTRAGSWCWINAAYINERLWLHYFWVIISEFGTLVIYTIILLILSKKSSTPASRAAKLIVAYPIIYVVCTLPLVVARLRSMAGQNVSFEELCVAGAMITSNGWLDVLLYCLTRRALIFGSDEMLGDITALDTFNTDSNWRPDFAFGTTTTIEANRQAASGGSPTVRPSMEALFGKHGRSRSVKTETVVEVQSEIMPPEAVYLAEKSRRKRVRMEK
ncbi:hypothetical protein M409DRAFT_70614 [Zasmidium cellare ATCC 36951]|uniref:G-protein coupled receptors family 1 profile domain-containing protein n=1 Tax=Zasmidium cellare ATCC 36951 TaxID=1080233 RepID=A0A6A6C1W7_ZASCE|nr:uncharacterized protein M409DRAFT_70614 [Zasmidium cellare ATCC 36951]KAF2160278.1 hypothetical protein M409DRAFT_70614 [Zasmidium cellare ATCC 36951]